VPSFHSGEGFSMQKVLVLVMAAVAAATVLVVQVGGAAPGKAITLSPIGTYASGVPFDGDFGAAEIPAYDAETQRVFVVNGQQKKIDVLDISTPSAPSLIGSIDLALRPNSVSAHDGLVAVALEADPKSDPGSVAFYPASCAPSACPLLNEVEAGALPDMVTFSPNGRFVLVANEGEALVNDEDAIVEDPKGTVTVIDLRQGVTSPIVSSVDFTSLDGAPTPPGMVLASDRLPSEDVEPEYITVSNNSKTAWVSLQEANAIAEIDVPGARVVAVRGLGFKDHGLAANSFDASDREATSNRGVINTCAWANVNGVYQPDSIASFKVGNSFYIVSANEGDARDPTLGSDDESRVGDLPAPLNAANFPAGSDANRNLGRLNVNQNLGLQNGAYDELFVYGARSFSIWSESGARVYDSGNQLERIVGSFAAPPASVDPYADPLRLTGPSVLAAKFRECPVEATLTTDIPPTTTPANSNHEEGPSFDNRSDNKGPEPEAVAVGKVRGQTYAFVGLERAGGIAVYNVTDPAAATFVEYVNPRDFTAGPYLTAGDDTTGDWEAAGDLGPEGIAFISEDDSPTGAPLLVVANEVSGTTTVYTITAA
jgi:hypothetical protein